MNAPYILYRSDGQPKNVYPADNYGIAGGGNAAIAAAVADRKDIEGKGLRTFLLKKGRI